MRQHKPNRKFNDLTGMQFNNWYVLEYIGISDRGVTKWLCQCSCSNVCEVWYSGLTSNRSKNCKQCSDKRKIKEYHISHYTSLVRGANKRGIEITLSKEEFDWLIDKPCYWCGDYFVRGKNSSGIDRYDNNEGYTLYNSVSCCPECNAAKNDDTPITFVERCKRIVNMWSD